ncbi:MAG: hypothetical protein KKA62_02905 [Nanoarchaeota archaeon]|nr:hypothetical protein [Nanoarchaeota archaeon]MBU1644633.1 hypothetical protein [Nanoarchaeota archaeon]MBU1976880.1 hypothetical protein [Nanoarchaeota archaeon]
MENYVFDEDVKSTEKVIEQEDLESSEEGFLRGYGEEDEVEECAECGSAVDEEKKVTKNIDGEDQVFCSTDCAEDFEENL